MQVLNKVLLNKIALALGITLSFTLAGCGGGNDDPADIYVGTWKSQCYSYVANNGGTYYTVKTGVNTKNSATEFTRVVPNSNAYTDAACSNLVGTGVVTQGTFKYTIGAKATFLGQSVDTYTGVTVASGTFDKGYMTANSTNLYIASNNTTEPSGWAPASPYTKQ